MEIYVLDLQNVMLEMYQMNGTYPPRKPEHLPFATLEGAQEYAAEKFGKSLLWSGDENRGVWSGMVPGVTGTMSAQVTRIEVLP